MDIVSHDSHQGESRIPSSQGGVSSNTPPATSQNLSSGGEDTVVIGCGVQWGERWEELTLALEQAKERAQENGRSELLVWQKLPFAVRKSGFGVGSGKGSYCRYVVENQGVEIAIVRRATPAKDIANVWITIGSLALMERGGLRPMWKVVREVVEVLGGTVLWDKLSRVDLCADVVGVTVLDFIQLRQNGCYVSRARKWRIEWTGNEIGDGATLYGGTGKLVVRIYDKVAETANDPRKRAVLVSRRWGTLPDCATRVEFQVRREVLRTFQIDTVDDYLRLRGPLASYLCTDWFRLTDSPVDRTHTLRAEVHTHWAAVQEHFAKWTERTDEKLLRVNRSRVNAYQLVRQAIGCLMTALVAESDGELYDYDDFCAESWERISEVLGRMNVEDAMAHKWLQWASRGPCKYNLMPTAGMA